MTDRAFDTILVGGTAFTAGWESSRLVGVGIRHGRIAAVDTDDRLRDAGAAEVVDARGALVMPAFYDAHAHPIGGGIELLQCDLSGAGNADDCVERIAAYAASHPDREWIQGGGWTMAHFPGGTPSRALLDAAVPDRPAVLVNRDHHGAWCNTEALRRAGITAATPDPADGRIEREPDGTPAGVLHEGAMRLMDAVAPGIDDALALAGLERAQADFFALGITGWQDAWVGRTAGVDDLLDVYLAAVDAATLRARVTAALWWDRERGLDQLDELRGKRTTVQQRGRQDVLIADTVKIMVDGVAENFTAAMSRPYLDACGHPTGNSGLTFVAPDALRDAVVALDAADFSVHLHALGDRAVTLALDAIDAARTANGPSSGRHQLAHLQVVQRRDVPRFAALGATANLQMLWGALDEALSELTFPFLDPELVGRHYPFRELRDAGAALAAGSDWPVSSADPIAAIHVAVNRAEPGARADERLHPEQAIDLATAVSAYTAGSAAAGGRGDTNGRLHPGAAADLVVLDRDPFAGPREDIHEAVVSRTFLAGVEVYAGDPS